MSAAKATVRKTICPIAADEPKSHQFQIAETRSDQRHDRLRQSQGKCQNECKMTGFSDHHGSPYRG